MAILDSINVGRSGPNPYKRARRTGIDKQAQTGPVEVREPGPKSTGLGSGIVGDYIGDGRHHGGSDQAIYAFAREDLDDWQLRLARSLPNGFFGENFTTRGLDVNEARLGERWQVGSEVEVVVTSPRIPCSTFRGWVGESGWLKMFTEVARPGAYLRVITPGRVQAGDAIEIVHRPDHDVTITLAYRATTTDRRLLPELLAAGPDLVGDLAEQVSRAATVESG